MHKTMTEFLKSLQLAGKHETARGYRLGLTQYDEWLDGDPVSATIDQIKAFQRYLAQDYLTTKREKLERSTQVTRLSAVKAYYAWLTERGLILIDVARKVKLPSVPKGPVRKDYLTLQEAIAVLQTQAKRCERYKKGSYRWAREFRDLTVLALMLASGRRRSGMRNLKVGDLNFKRNELRCEWEKGKGGRVLPVADWAMKIAKLYVDKARPILDWQGDADWLLVGDRSERMGHETIHQVIRRVHAETVKKNPDLEDLAQKVITPHSFRVSFATMLFSNGCDIRTINELMMHDQLTTTARYTPIPLEDLQRVCRKAHPRA